MKKIKNNYKILIGFIIGMIVSGSSVLAATTYAIDSKFVKYTDNSSLGATNVQDAIDKTCSNLDDKLTNLMPSTYTKPTAENGVTISSGGYYIIGNVVVVNMLLRVNTTILSLSSDVNYGTKVVSGLPVPKESDILLPTYFISASSSGTPMITGSETIVNSDGLYFINNNSQYLSNCAITISGTYLMA